MPVVEWGFTTIPMGTILQEYSIIGLGLPPFQYFIDAIPLALAAYIIAFGDILVMDSLFKNADSVRKDEKLVFSADSDAIITKGLVGLMVRVLSEHTPEEISKSELYFIDKIGLKEHLSPNRANGLSSMIKKMKFYAIAHLAKTDKG